MNAEQIRKRVARNKKIVSLEGKLSRRVNTPVNDMQYVVARLRSSCGLSTNDVSVVLQIPNRVLTTYMSQKGRMSHDDIETLRARLKLLEHD